MSEIQFDSDDPMIGQLITGRYRVQSRIGEGGMGTVYLALHEAIEKRIALKVLHREYSSNTEVVERFKQEAISASRIKHPNVIDVFDFGQLEDGSCFIAMELLEGQDLGDLLAQKGALPPEIVVRIGLQICRALGLAHSRGVVHRDLKPENVFLQRTPEDPRVVKIVDFGIAQLRNGEEQEPEETRRRRLTKTGMIFGTPEYMAPEQARGKAVDQRTDIYAAGIILYEMLTGKVPFTGESFLEVLNQHVLDRVPPLAQVKPDLQISEELSRIVSVSLSKSADDRFPTMKHLAQALLKTPEGRALQNKLHGEGLSAEQLTDELLSGIPPAHLDSDSRKVKTISGVPPLDQVPTNYGTDRTPPAHLLTAAAEPKRSPLPLLFFVLTVALLGGGAWAWLHVFSQASAGGDVAAAAHAEAAGPSADPEVPEQAAPDRTAASGPLGAVEGEQSSEGDGSKDQAAAVEPPEKAAEQESPQVVVLHVETVPAGAVVLKGDFQVCDSSPCDVEVEREEAVVLRASKGTQNGTARVLAQQDQKVSIILRAPQRRAPAKPAPAPTQRTCEVMVDGLKILRPCE